MSVSKYLNKGAGISKKVRKISLLCGFYGCIFLHKSNIVVVLITLLARSVQRPNCTTKMMRRPAKNKYVQIKDPQRTQLNTMRHALFHVSLTIIPPQIIVCTWIPHQNTIWINLFINLTNGKMYRCNTQTINSNDTSYFCQTHCTVFQHVMTTAPPNGDLDESLLHSFVGNFPLLTLFDIGFALVINDVQDKIVNNGLPSN